jgi:hypothetical protein
VATRISIIKERTAFALCASHASEDHPDAWCRKLDRHWCVHEFHSDG